MKRSLVMKSLIVVLVFFWIQPLAAVADSEPSKRNVFVDCDAGKTISQALNRRGNKLTIVFYGTCEEDVLIDRDNVILRGARELASTLIGNVTVAEARKITISDFTIKDSTNLRNGIDVVAGSSVKIRDMVVENSVSRGIRIRDSVAEITDVTVTGSGTVGILCRGSKITFEGDILVSDSAEIGIVLTNGTTGFSKEGNIVVTNALLGFVVQLTSSFEAVFGKLTTTGHTVAGISLSALGAFVYGATIESTGNGTFGLLVDDGSSFSPFFNISDIATTTLSGNGLAGAAVGRNSTFALAGTSTVTGQPFGIFGGSGSVIQLTDAVVTGNFVLDISLDFGSLGDFLGGNTVGVISCTDGARSQGDVSCP